MAENETNPEAPTPKKPKRIFPKRPCPRCGVNDTEAYKTKGDTQYRRCRRVICQKRYPVKAVESGKTGKQTD